MESKNTARAFVRVGYDGRVHKFFKGPQARERYENELRVLNYLEENHCDFVPKVLSKNDAQFYLITSNCGARVDRMSEGKRKQTFAELEKFGVRHEDPELRNITYCSKHGRFCIIDFEFATILKPGYPPSPKISSIANRQEWRNKGA